MGFLPFFEDLSLQLPFFIFKSDNIILPINSTFYNLKSIIIYMKYKISFNHKLKVQFKGLIRLIPEIP